MLGRPLLGSLAIVILGAVGFGVLAYRPAIATITADQRPKIDAAVVESGRILASAGYCAT